MDTWRRVRSRQPANVATSVPTDDESEHYHNANSKFTSVQGKNSTAVSYQDASGAPIERNSPFGYHVSWYVIIFLNVNRMIGTGIFATPGSILGATGSVGLALIYWLIGAAMTYAGFAAYLELASYFPSRSGSEVVYLEQAYPRPKYLLPIAFAVKTVILSFSSSNAIILSQYLWRAVGRDPSAWQMKGVAIAMYTCITLSVIAHNRYAFYAITILGIIKIITLIFISITGFVVLGGHVSRIPDPRANFRNAFEGTTTNGNDLSKAIVSIAFAYSGYSNAFNVTNEIKNPVKSLKKYGLISITVVTVLYMLCNVAYFAAVDKHTFGTSKETAAGVFFTAVFGPGAAETALNVLVLLSAFGNLMSVIIGESRMVREVARQGVLPFQSFWVSTKPFGTPLGPYLLNWVMSFIMIAAPPAGDAFRFVISLKSYPDAIFHVALALGIYIIRRRRTRNNIPRSEFRAWDVLIVFFNLVQIFILIMPWWPPKGGPYAGDVSFWYATYAVVGIAVVLLSGVYYFAWMYAIPRWRGYRIRAEIIKDATDNVTSHKLVKVKADDLLGWDAQHDEAGYLIITPSATDTPKHNSSI